MENWDEKPAGQTNQRRGRLVFVSWLLQIQTNQESRPRPEFQLRGFAQAVNVIAPVSISSIDSRLYGTRTWWEWLWNWERKSQFPTAASALDRAAFPKSFIN